MQESGTCWEIVDVLLVIESGFLTPRGGGLVHVAAEIYFQLNVAILEIPSNKG